MTLTNRLERLPGLGAAVLAETLIEAGDVVIAVTSMEYSRSVQPRQSGMLRLFKTADLVLDDLPPLGDAL